ncbi:MAG: electron transport complex subunit E [Eubacteriales bacterium]
MKSSNHYLRSLTEGLFDNNPVLVQLLGTCPTLAVTVSVSNALGMGIATTATLVMSGLLISLLRRFIPSQVRIAAFIVIISGFVTAVELLMQAFAFDLSRSLGVFLPLITVNCILLARAEAFASKHPPLPSLWDGFVMGLGFTFALLLIGSVREVLGNGTFLGVRILPAGTPAALLIAPAGAFLVLGTLIACVNAIRNRLQRKQAKREVVNNG